MTLHVEAGFGVTLVGAGTSADPYRVGAIPALIAAGTQTNCTVEISGENTPSKPTTLAIYADAAALGLNLMWDRWVGSQPDYDTIPVAQNDTIYVVAGGGLYAGGPLDNLMTGSDQVLRVYQGATLVAENNNPGIDPPA